MTSAPPKSMLPFYPDYCLRLSPTIDKWCPLWARDVHALRDVGMFYEGRTLFHHGNHPIKWVRLTGVIVAIDEYSGRKVYTLDDSSGICIECTCIAPIPPPTELNIPAHLNQQAGPLPIDSNRAQIKPKNQDKAQTENKGPSVQNPLVPWDNLDVGVVVKVKGKVGAFRDMKQVEVVKIEVLRSTDPEVRCWNEVMAFKKDVLGKEWIVSKEEEGECKKEREREERHARKRKERELEKEKEKQRLRMGGVSSREKGTNIRVKQEGSVKARESEEARRRRKEKERREASEGKKRRPDYLSMAVKRAAGMKGSVGT